jgi:hypothetical protein
VVEEQMIHQYIFKEEGPKMMFFRYLNGFQPRQSTDESIQGPAKMAGEKNSEWAGWMTQVSSSLEGDTGQEECILPTPVFKTRVHNSVEAACSDRSHQSN